MRIYSKCINHTCMSEYIFVNPYGEKPQREEALNSYKYFLTYQKAYAILNQGEKHELYNI